MSNTKNTPDMLYHDGMSSSHTSAQQQIEQALSEPARARDNAIEVQNRSVREMIEADKYLRKSRVSNPLGAIKIGKIRFGRPGGL